MLRSILPKRWRLRWRNWYRQLKWQLFDTGWSTPTSRELEREICVEVASLYRLTVSCFHGLKVDFYSLHLHIALLSVPWTWPSSMIIKLTTRFATNSRPALCVLSLFYFQAFSHTYFVYPVRPRFIPNPHLTTIGNHVITIISQSSKSFRLSSIVVVSSTTKTPSTLLRRLIT